MIKLPKNIIDRIKGSSLVKDSFWAVFGNGFGNACLLLAGIFMARLLGKDVFGEYGFIKTAMYYGATFATLGLHYSSTKFIAGYISDNEAHINHIIKSVLSITFISNLIIGIIVALIAAPLAKFIDVANMTNYLRFLGFLIVLRGLINVQNGILSGFKHFKRIATNNIISGSVMISSCVPLTYFFGLLGSVLALSLTQLVNVILNQISIKKKASFYIDDIEKGISRYELIKFSLPLAVNDIIYTLFGWASNIILVKFSSTGQLALYTTSTQWNVIISMIPVLLQNVILSYLSSASNDANRQLGLVKKMLLINFVCTLIPFLVVCALANWISAFYGRTFSDMAPVLRITIFATIFNCCSNVFYYQLISLNRTVTVLIARTTRDAVILLVSYFLIVQNPETAAIRYAIANVLGIFVYFIILWIIFICYQKKIRVMDV